MVMMTAKIKSLVMPMRTSIQAVVLLQLLYPTAQQHPLYNIQGHIVQGVCPGQFPRPDGPTLASMQLLTYCEETPCNETTWDGAPPSVMDFLFERPFYLANLIEAAVLQPMREAPLHDITLITVFSMPRLRNLARQCDAWPGTISAALYLPLMRHPDGSVVVASDHTITYHASHQKWDPAAAISFIAGHHAAIQEHGRCALRLSLYVEDLPVDFHHDPTVNFVWSMPVNALRNKALLHATTDVVLYADGDFVPGPVHVLQGIMHGSTTGYGYGQLRADLEQRNIVVAPALMSWGETPLLMLRAVQAAITITHKSELLPMFAQQQLSEFPPYHVHTNISHWLGSDAPYTVEYNCHEADFVQGHHYEPYFFALRDAIPLADERYRGYWANKIAWLDDIRAAGFNYIVNPDVFLVHAPHTHTASMFAGRVRFAYLKHRLLFDNCHRSRPYYPVALVTDPAFCGEVGAEVT